MENIDLEWIGVTENVATITLNDVFDVLGRHGYQHIDLVKIDIEGAELKVLCNNNDWLNRVKTIVMEVHPQNYGKRGLESIIRTLKQRGFSVFLITERIDCKQSFVQWLRSVKKTPSTLLLAIWKAVVAIGFKKHSIQYVLAKKQIQRSASL